MRLHAIKAEEGDCLLIESSDAEPRRLLIDGGPPGTWDAVAGDYIRGVITSYEHVSGTSLRLKA